MKDTRSEERGARSEGEMMNNEITTSSQNHFIGKKDTMCMIMQNENNNPSNKKLIRGQQQHSDANRQGQTGTVFEDAELIFAREHLARIKRLEIAADDLVLVTVPMREPQWLEVVDACIYRGADFVLPDSETDLAALGAMIQEKNISAIAITPAQWKSMQSILLPYLSGSAPVRVVVVDGTDGDER